MKLSVKIGIIVGCILLLFIFLNPSLDKFKEHLGYISHYGLRRTSEFLVCTIYEDGTQDPPVKYLGILSNFIKLNTNNPTTEIYTTSDTTKTVDITDTTSKHIPSYQELVEQSKQRQKALSYKVFREKYYNKDGTLKRNIYGLPYIDERK
jgi:hypothetical protein